MVVNNWLIRYADAQRNKRESVSALKSLNYLQALQALLMGLAFFGPGKMFYEVKDLNYELWYAFTYKNFELWDILFPVGAIVLFVSTATLTGVKYAQGFLSAIWVIFGSVWIYAGIVTDGNFLFGLGLLGIFIGAQHLVFARIWSAEGFR